MKLLFSFFFFFLFTSVKSLEWKNWANNIICHPTKLLSPSSLEELQKIIKQAHQEKKHVRAIGTGHSWTDILCSDGYMINTDNLNKVLAIDKEKKQIHVQAGIKLKDLIQVLTENNLALPNQPAITEQSIAGVIATATHGTGHTGTMASFIKKIELLAADGNIYELSEQNQSDLFAAACVSVGSLGILYAVTVQCVPLFKVKYHQYRTSWEDIKTKYQKLNTENDFFSFFYHVQDEYVTVDIWNRTNEPVPNAVFVNAKNRIKTVYNWIVNTLQQLFPTLIASESLQLDDPTIQYSYAALSGPPSPFYLEEEIAIEQSLLPEVVQEVKKLIHVYKSKGITIYGILCRFVQADKNALLSPAADRNVVFVSITTTDKEIYPFFRDYYKLMLKFNGRPHWGKINYLNFEDAQKLYGQNFEKFIKAREKLDPIGMFSNEFTKRVFGSI